MVLEWLRSERHKPGAPSINGNLLDQPDLTDETENRLRLLALRSYRGPIIDPLPAGVQPHLVTIEAIDLDKLYIVPTFDWFLDTGGTFRLIDTAANLKPGRGYLSPQGPQAIAHYQEVTTRSKYLADYDATTTDEFLILIAASDAGPYTIIDGTHRATALYLNHLEAPNLPWRAMLLSDPRMANCLWHIESPQARTAIRTNQMLVSGGSLF
jgi:hypothetical protein